MTLIDLQRIIIDPQVQLRERRIDNHTVSGYAEAITNGAQFPPVVVFDDGEKLWLGDGYHRVSAYRYLGRTEIEADIRAGNRQDAMVFTCTANVTNGRPMSRDEKKEAGERLLKLTNWPNTEIAKRLAVSNVTVMRWRENLSSKNVEDKTIRTVTRNGQTYTMDTSRIGKQGNQPPVDNRPLFADDPDLDAALDDESKPVCQNCGQVYDGANCPDCHNEQPVQPELPTPARLICGDFASIANEIEPGSIDVIITDPPYPKEFLHLYGLLARQAAKLLKPGGSLLAMCGQSYLPDIMALMTPHIAYHWTLSYQTPGGQSPQIWPKKVNTFWKPVLWFVKGEYGGLWHGDVIKSDVNDNDKRFHEWGQSESGIARLVNDHSLPGDLILDPFCGGGTTGAVAVALSRRFIGIDKDPVAIETSKKRLANGH